MTGYLPGPVTSVSLPIQPLYMNTLPRTTNVGIPIAESTPAPPMGPTLFRPTPAHRVRDILEPSSDEQARAKYLEEQMRHMKSIRLSHSNDRSIVSESHSREIQEYCSQEYERHQYEKETHQVMLESMREQKERQRQQSRRECDEMYKQMTNNLEKVRAIARESLSRASTVLVEERQMTLTRTDFRNIKEKMKQN